MIRFDRVSFRYNENLETSFILKEVSFHLEKGHLVGIIGKNGSGKSTIGRIAAGLINTSTGSVFINDQEISVDEVETKNKVGLIFQNPDSQIVGLTVEEDLAFGLENQGLPGNEIFKRIQNLSEMFGLRDFLEKPVEVLSGGQKQLLCIASVLITEPEWIIFDEPTSHLDPWAREKFWSVLRDLKDNQEKGIAVISQIESDFMNFDRVLILNEGKAILLNPEDPGFWEKISDYGLDVPEEVKFGILNQ